MKKTINVSLGRVQHTLEEDAYERLQTYLGKLKNSFTGLKDGDEVLADIEARFSEQLSGPAGSVVTLEEINRIIASMGEPEEIGGKEAQKTEIRQDGKQLFRNPDDCIVAGVASGLSAYFGMDPIWLRLAFGLSLLVGGFGLAVYIILWVIIPEAKTDTDKMRMRGTPVNLENIQQLVKERSIEAESRLKAGASGFSGNLGKFLQVLVRGLGVVLKNAWTVICAILGISLLAGAGIAIAGLVVGMSSAIFNINSQFVDFPFRELAHGSVYYVTMAGFFMAVLIPLTFLMVMGASLVARESKFSKISSFTLLGLWFISLAVAANGAFYFAPQVREIVNTSPYFKSETRELSVGEFRDIDMNDAVRINLHKGEEYRVVMTGTQKAFEENVVRVESGVLVNDKRDEFRLCIFCTVRSVTLDVYAPNIGNISLSDASRISGEFWGVENKVSLDDASRAVLNMSSGKLHASVSDASSLEIGGSVEDVTVNVKDASRFYAEKATIKKVVVNASDASWVRLGEVQDLVARARDASRITYFAALTQDLGDSDASRIEQVQADSYLRMPEPIMMKPIEMR